MFDFTWVNATLYGGAYLRDESYFGDSAMSSVGRPADAYERALLAPFPGAVRADALEGNLRPPISDGSGRDRVLAERSLAELADAGFTLHDASLRDRNGAPFRFEILVKTRWEERLAMLYAQSLGRIGIGAEVRLVDETQFQRRRGRFDFDVIPASFPASASPGAEQRGRWGAASADMEGAYNVAGVRSMAIDAVIAAMLAEKDPGHYISAVRALDRLLLSGFYLAPFFHTTSQWVAYSTKLRHPVKTPLFGPDIDAWWFQASLNVH